MLLSFNLVPERFHIPDIVYPLFLIHYDEHLRFHLLTKKFKCEDLSMATKIFYVVFYLF